MAVLRVEIHVHAGVPNEVARAVRESVEATLAHHAGPFRVLIEPADQPHELLVRMETPAGRAVLLMSGRELWTPEEARRVIVQLLAALGF